MHDTTISAISPVSEATFAAEVVVSKGAMVVGFWAPSCAPCRALGATLEQAAPEFAGRVRVAKVNVDENPGLAETVRISSIPSMIFFTDGKPVGAISGAMPASDTGAKLFTGS